MKYSKPYHFNIVIGPDHPLRKLVENGIKTKTPISIKARVLATQSTEPHDSHVGVYKYNCYLDTLRKELTNESM